MIAGVPYGPSRSRPDIWLLASTGLMILFGLATLYSVDQTRYGGAFFPRQVVFAIIGIGLLILFSRISQEFIQRAVPWLYTLSMALLCVVLVSDSKKGASRWLDIGPMQFQPSELTKLVMILTLASFFSSRKQDIREWKTFWQSLGIAALPVPLLLLQPHFGATVGVLVIWFCMSFYSGMSGRRILGVVLGVFALLFVVYKSNIPLFAHIPPRIDALLGIGDSQGNRYQQEQAILAIGNGGVLGQGFMRGERTKGAHIPEQQNDFIFTVIGEEGGLVGCVLFLAAISFFFYRAWLVGFSSPSYTGRVVAAGVLGVLAFHTIVNLGMNIGVTPVIGLWLPFTSSGGTALWFCMCCVGLLLAARNFE